MTSHINLSGHASRTDRARYNEAQGIEILRGNSRDAHAETADHRPGSPARDGAAQPVEPAHARLRPGARVGVPHVPGRRHQLHHVERRAAARRGLLGIDARAVRHLVRERDLPSALRDAYQSPRLPVPRTGPHHRRHACTRLRDAARCSVDRAMRAGLDLDRCRIGIDRSGVRRAVPQRRSSSHFVRSAARLPHRGGPLPRRARLAACWSMRDLCAAARDFRLDPVREAENMVVENRAHRAAFRDPLGQVLLEDRHMRMPHRHGRRRGARGVHHRERRNRGHLLPFPLAVVEPAYHRHHLRLRAVLQQDGPAPRVPLGDAGHGRVLHAAARVHRFLRNREHHRVGGLRHVQRAYLDTPRRHLVHVPAFGHHGVRHRLGHGDARRAAGLVVGTVRVRVRAVLAASA